MLTRRENLLIRPWQERRYISHRLKVETALPAIDNTPPASRQHVTYKMKKFQREKERCCQVVSDNFTLLQHLDYIRRTTRVNNAWDEPPPNFLNRVGIYTSRRSDSSENEDLLEVFDQPKNRKERCYGCSPQRYVVKLQIPEERIPFAPPKKKVSRKLQSPPDIQPKKVQVEEKAGRRVGSGEETSDERKAQPEGGGEAGRRMRRKARRAIRQQTQSILLSRGPVTLRLFFPTDSGLVFNDKGETRVLNRQVCHCAARSTPSSG